MNHTRSLKNTCLDAERLYRRCVDWMSDPYLGSTDEELELEDRLLNRLRAVYRTALHDLNQAGVGGVLINGIFRSTECDV